MSVPSPPLKNNIRLLTPSQSVIRDYESREQRMAGSRTAFLGEARRTGFETKVAIAAPTGLGAGFGVFVVAVDAEGNQLTRSPSVALHSAKVAPAGLGVGGDWVEKGFGGREL